jgi:hypothetical protein
MTNKIGKIIGAPPNHPGRSTRPLSEIPAAEIPDNDGHSAPVLANEQSGVMNVHNPESKARLFEAVRTHYEKRFGGPILVTSDEEIFTLCGQVFGAAPTDETDRGAFADYVLDRAAKAIWMSPRESSARKRRFTARWPADNVPGAD